MVRVVAGVYGGRHLDAPGRKSTHAMSERARSALFNNLASLVDGAAVLDVYAGSGALGIEALSRGAAHATFIEKDRIAAKIIQKNCDVLGITEQTDVINTTINNWLQTSKNKHFNLIFADPPYHDPQLPTALKLQSLLEVGGYMVLSHPGKGEVPVLDGIVVVDNRSYGNANLTFFRRERR